MPVSRYAINFNNYYYAGRIAFPGYAYTAHLVFKLLKYVLSTNVSFQTTEMLNNIIFFRVFFFFQS